MPHEVFASSRRRTHESKNGPQLITATCSKRAVVQGSLSAMLTTKSKSIRCRIATVLIDAPDWFKWREDDDEKNVMSYLYDQCHKISLIEPCLWWNVKAITCCCLTCLSFYSNFKALTRQMNAPTLTTHFLIPLKCENMSSRNCTDAALSRRSFAILG